ncbi:MAG: hypothetical protein ACE15B_04575 [Bryobacteraceae bacterium]
MRHAALYIAAAASLLWAGETDRKASPVLVKLGPATLKPSGFLDSIGMTRSATTPDSVSTGFGKIPLADSPGESLGTVRHSRLMLKGDLPAGPLKFSGYAESDFMNFAAGQSPYRWRQYWGQAAIGKWEILGGRAWSLLRPNRFGTASDRDTMNTDVTDPAYHTGLLGSRTRQVRITRAMGRYRAALAWEGDGNVLGKFVRDGGGHHFELGGFAGRFGRRGVTAAGVVAAAPRLRVVTQQYWSKRAAHQALGVVPAGVNGVSTLEGVEVQATKNLELYSYAGLVYAARLNSAANRVVGQWTVGFNRKVATPPAWGGMLLSVQYSHIDRAIWSGPHASMDYLMYRVRYTFN